MANFSYKIKLAAVLLGLIGLVPFFVAADSTTDARILELQKQIAELTKQADRYRKNIDQKQKEADTLNRQIGLLNNQILKLQTQIAITGKQIDTATVQIGNLETRIFDTQEKINQNKRAVSQLLGLIAQRDHLTLAAVLVKSARLSDFSDAVNQDENLNQKLNGLLVTLKDEKDQLQTDKSALEGKKHELENLNQQQQQQRFSATATKTSKDKLLVDTKGKEAAYQRMLDDVEMRKEAFFNELKQLEANAIQGGTYIVHITANRAPPRGAKLFQWPEDDYRVTQGYGLTKWARRGAYGGAAHNGVDISNGLGAPIKAAADGKVLASGNNSGWGNWVAVVHPQWELVTLYAHMNAPAVVAVGLPVAAGTVIGYQGNTGNSTGSHLHFSVYRDFFTYLNPKNGQLYFNYFEGTLNPLDYF